MAASAALIADLAIAAATLEPAAATAAQVATWRAAVAHAERSGRASPVAHAWLGLAERAGPLELDAAAVDHALAQADWAIGRVGDPPRLRVRWLATAGSVAWVRGDIASAKRRFVAAAALAGDDPALAPARSRAYAMLATATGDDGKAVETYRTLLADRDVVARMPVADRIVLHSSLSEALYRLGELAEALRENEAARALARDALPPGDPSRLMDELVHASILVDQGDARGSLAAVDGALPRLVASLGARHPLAAAARIRRAQALLALERATEAEAALAEAIAILDDRYAHRSEEAIVARALLAEVHARAGRHDRRAAVLDEALRDAAALYGTSHVGWAQIAAAAGEARAAAGRAADAVPLLEAALPILAASGSPDQTARARFALAKLLVDTDTPRSVALARTAEAELAKLPHLAKLHADVVAWLAGR